MNKRSQEPKENARRQRRRVDSNDEASSSDTPPVYAAETCSIPVPSYDDSVAIQPYIMDELLATYQGQILSKTDVWKLIKETPDCTSLLVAVGIYLINNGRIDFNKNYKPGEQAVSEGLAILECAAEVRNHPIAHHVLGSYLFLSVPDKAERHLRIAARAGVAQSFAYVGQLIKRRGGSLKEAFSFFKQGALLDDAEAHYALFTMLLVGLDCVKDSTRAMEHLRRAAELGNRQAMFRYATALFEGKGVQKNISDAITFYGRAAVKGCEKSTIFLGKAHRKGIFPLAKSYIDSYKWYNRVINEPEAKYQIARFLLKGRVARQENWEIQAENLLDEAVRAGNNRAMYRLGLLKLKQPNRIEEARQQIKQAAENGYSSAYKRLAKMERSAGDLDKALYYLHKGYQANDVACIFRLGEVYLDTNSVLANQAEGNRLVTIAAQRGYLKAKIFTQRRGLNLNNRPVVNVTTPSEKKHPK